MHGKGPTVCCLCQVKVLINDTMGVLAAGRYRNPDAMIGLILGTGAHPLLRTVLPPFPSVQTFRSPAVLRWVSMRFSYSSPCGLRWQAVKGCLRRHECVLCGAV